MGDLGFLDRNLAVLLAMQVEPGDNLLERLWNDNSATGGWVMIPLLALSQVSFGMQVGRDFLVVC